MATEGIGDLSSTEKGSGARKNAGKDDWSLLPLRAVAELLRPIATLSTVNLVECLYCLGNFQEDWSHVDGKKYLHAALNWLGPLDTVLSKSTRVFEFGKGKYAPWNWAKGMPWSVPLACAARHIRDVVLRGETVDADSGEDHIGHIACNIFMLLHYLEFYQAGNDLPPSEYFRD